MAGPIVVTADPEARVWVATSRDLRGLMSEAETLEALRAKLPGMILDLLEEAGDSDLPASIELIARASDRLVAASKGLAPAMADSYRDVVARLRAAGLSSAPGTR